MSKTISKSRLWMAHVMSGIVILIMLIDSIMKFIQPEQVVTAHTELGFVVHHILLIGILEFISILLYVYPRTSILGAILLTGYWGGAIATHVRLDNPLFTHILFPVYFAIFAWGAIWLRDRRVQNLIPLRKKVKLNENLTTERDE